MNNELMNTIITTIVVPLLVTLTGFAITYMKAKTRSLEKSCKNDELHKYIDLAGDTVAKAVQSVSQTYVDSLRSSGTFDQAAQQEAFERAKIRVLSLLTEQSKIAINELYGDVEKWLEMRIEYEVKQNKTK